MHKFMLYNNHLHLETGRESEIIVHYRNWHFRIAERKLQNLRWRDHNALCVSPVLRHRKQWWWLRPTNTIIITATLTAPSSSGQKNPVLSQYSFPPEPRYDLTQFLCSSSPAHPQHSSPGVRHNLPYRYLGFNLTFPMHHSLRTRWYDDYGGLDAVIMSGPWMTRMVGRRRL